MILNMKIPPSETQSFWGNTEFLILTDTFYPSRYNALQTQIRVLLQKLVQKLNNNTAHKMFWIVKTNKAQAKFS